MKGAVIYGTASVLQSGTTLAVTLAVAAQLTPTVFAEFSFLVFKIGLFALIIDLGVGQSTLRGMAAEKEPNIFVAGLRVKWMIASLLTLATVVHALITSSIEMLLVAVSASLISLNATARVWDTFRQDYRNLIKASTAMVATAAAGVATMRFFANWQLTAALTLALPPLIAGLLRAKADEFPRWTHSVNDLRRVLRFAPYLYVSGLLFASILPMSLVLLKPRLNPVEYSALALAASIAGALSIVITSFRASSYAHVAEILAGEERVTRRQLLDFGRAASPIAVAYIVGVVAMSAVVATAYAVKYPGIVATATFLALGYGFTGILGLFNIRHQVSEMFWTEIVVNAGRWSLVALALIGTSVSALSSAAIIAVGVVVGEIAYALVGEQLRQIRPRTG